MKHKVIIERTKDDQYCAYMDYYKYDFGLNGFGQSAQEAINDIFEAKKEANERYLIEGKIFPEFEFVFHYDISSCLSYYSDKISLAGLGRLTGINRKQLSHYVNGNRKPSKHTVEKIEKSLHDFGTELSQIHFV